MSKRIELKNPRAEGIYKNLDQQLKKIAKHNRQGSYATKDTYLDRSRAFAKYLASEWGTQKFTNVQDKHIEGYIDDMKERGLSASSIKNNLTAVRFFHEKSGSRYELSGNEAYDLEKRTYRGVEREWSTKEYEDLKDLCVSKVQANKYGADTYRNLHDCSTLARTMGLRIHECTEISRNDVEKALNTGSLHVTGKGGKPRDVPLSDDAREVLSNRIAEIPRGTKLYVDHSEGEQTHTNIKNMQNTINRTRSMWEEERDAREPNRTFHGLRHCFAREMYEQKLEEGMGKEEAKEYVSKLLGHERGDVTLIYLASL